MLRSLILLLCFVLITYAWAKYAASLETFKLSEVKLKPDWYWPEPNPDHKGLPLAFTGKDHDGYVSYLSYATYMDRFSDPMGYSDYENNFAFKITFSTLLTRGVLYVDQLEGQGLMFMSLHKGRLRLTFIHNLIPQVKDISGPVNDLELHTVKVQRVPEENKINVQVDKQPVSSYALALPDSFRGGINIYLGGIPLGLKTYNKVHGEPSFIGCIHSGAVLNKGQLEPFSLYNFTIIGDVTSSCQPPTFIRLYGDGYAEAPFPGDPNPNFKFSFSFRASSPDGLLFMDLSSKSMYVAVYLKEGYLWIAINDGGLTTEKVSQGPVSDNLEHKVSVQEAGAINIVWVYIDDHQKGVKFKNRVSFVNGSRIMLGGMPGEEPYNQVAEDEKVLYQFWSGDISDVSCNGHQVSPSRFKVR